PRASNSPRIEDVTPEVEVTLLITSMFSINETLAIAYLDTCRQRAVRPLVQKALQLLLADEIDHGRIGWAHLASDRVSQTTRVAVARWLPTLVRWNFEMWIDRVNNLQCVAEAEGYPSADVLRAALEHCVRTLIIPGFARVGLPIHTAWHSP